MGSLALDDRPNKRRRKSRKAETVPSWEKTRSFEEKKQQTASLPVIRQDGQVQRLNIPHPKFFVKAQTKKIPPSDIGTPSPQPVDGDGRPTAHSTAYQGGKRKTKNASKAARMKGRQQLEVYAKRMEDFEATKAQIAGIASKIIADPEKRVGMLKELRQMAQSYKGKAAALVILTESQLYKDIVPTYRIRPITEKEAEVKVSKEVSRLRTFEESLLANYQRFVKSLVSLTRWRNGGATETEAGRSMTAVRMAACRALAELSRSLPHFNEAEAVTNAVCSLVADREELVRQQSADALKAVLGDAHRASGQTLSTCVLIAKQLANVAATKLSAAPAEVVEPLVNIQFASFSRLPLSKRAKNEPKKSKRFIKKRRRKPEKLEDGVEETEIEKDLREGDAEATPQELYAAKKGLLESVCHAYFNIIKSASCIVEQNGESKTEKKTRRKKPPPALATALKGLLRVASFINADIIEAILGALMPLLETDRLPLATRFRCLSAAYAVLGVHSRSQKADPDSFTGDARALDTSLYAAVGCLYGMDTPIKEEEYMSFDAIETILSSISYREMPPTRCASLARRLSVLASSSAPTHACSIGLLHACQLILPPALVTTIFCQKEGATEGDFGGESGLVQRFDMASNDPEIASAERSAAWELACLVAHFHPAVREVATNCSRGICGEQLPRTSENILLTAKSHSSAQGGFNPAPQSAWTGQLKKSTRCVDVNEDRVLKYCFPNEDKRKEFLLDYGNAEEILDFGQIPLVVPS